MSHTTVQFHEERDIRESILVGEVRCVSRVYRHSAKTVSFTRAQTLCRETTLTFTGKVSMVTRRSSARTGPISVEAASKMRPKFFFLFRKSITGSTANRAPSQSDLESFCSRFTTLVFGRKKVTFSHASTD